MPAVMASFSFFALAIRSAGEVGGPERLRDHDVGVGQFSSNTESGAVLVGCHHQRVAGVLKELAQAELAGDAAEQLARLEVDRLRRRCGLAVGIAVDLGDVVAGVGRG